MVRNFNIINFAKTLIACSILCFGTLFTTQLYAQSNTAKIGVLAFRGEGNAILEWQPLANYLTEVVDEWEFEIIPVTLVSAPEHIRAKNLDFLITNPGHYVTLAEQFGLSVLATRERRAEVGKTGLLQYGTAIFSLADNGISQLHDLKGKRLAAVSPDAFGGFQLAWHEFMAQEIDPFVDLEAIRFMGFPQDEIVSAVLTGTVEAGVVRSGLLESLEAENRINIDDFVVLQSNSQMGHPYKISGHLYPEWPMTALSGINKTLREEVTVALLKTQNLEGAKSGDLMDVWSAPISYESVRTLVAAYNARNLVSNSNQVSLSTSIILILISAIGGIFLLAFRAGQVSSNNNNDVHTSENEVTDDEPETIRIKERFDRLTKREREILSMICGGQHSKEIAEKLGISPKTVEYHRSNLLHKTKAGTTARLVQLATRLEYDLGFSLGASSQ